MSKGLSFVSTGTIQFDATGQEVQETQHSETPVVFGDEGNSQPLWKQLEDQRNLKESEELELSRFKAPAALDDDEAEFLESASQWAKRREESIRAEEGRALLQWDEEQKRLQMACEQQARERQRERERRDLERVLSGELPGLSTAAAAAAAGGKRDGNAGPTTLLGGERIGLSFRKKPAGSGVKPTLQGGTGGTGEVKRKRETSTSESKVDEILKKKKKVNSLVAY
eukprot:NODE_774_length_1914_cov_26.057373_g716_i0.p2 GENE.NODE_774_length_1914_cov_26.057373_g716_i0~~NODE_774_length_1914_cov_26.057373_g716_i0.p2  ORF type:complete len:226 (+),score=65.17 NODE_774_length_1914_cov_26.057373_g716_i0:1071-1748(+)